MKKAMKAAMVAALVMVSAAASAQFSVNVGYVNTGVSFDPDVAMDAETPDYKGSDLLSTHGISLGVGYDMSIQGGFGLGLGLNYTLGFNSKKLASLGDASVSMKGNSHALDVPVRVTYTYPISDNFKVFGFAGPKFVYALAGQSKMSFKGVDDADEEEPIYWYGKDKEDRFSLDLNPFDIKLGVGAGVNISNILVKVGYDWGMLNAAKKEVFEDDDTKIKSNQFYVTVGYAF
ncbi:MAG: PorT family protein [Prevotellaceae bacterium]|jgi:opacity protein-like surface antigen|nr:PorT family protein [Prevotellaceae bacterium]